MPEFDQRVIVTSAGKITIVRLNGTEEQVGQLRPQIDAKVHTETPVSLRDVAPSWNVWTFIAESKAE